MTCVRSFVLFVVLIWLLALPFIWVDLVSTFGVLLGLLVVWLVLQVCFALIWWVLLGLRVGVWFGFDALG